MTTESRHDVDEIWPQALAVVFLRVGEKQGLFVCISATDTFMDSKATTALPIQLGTFNNAFQSVAGGHGCENAFVQAHVLESFIAAEDQDMEMRARPMIVLGCGLARAILESQPHEST